MNPSNFSNNSRFTGDDWDKVRTRFQGSIMIDTSLNSLAENLEVKPWPFRGEDETAAKYIDLTFAQLQLTPNFLERPECIDLLITILLETLAFDDPFGEMVAKPDADQPQEDIFLKNLARLGIPADFPIGLTRFSEDTKRLCELEGVATLGAFAVLAQGMAQNVIIGGDFRTLLNALAHLDGEGLAEFLPFRPGSRGLHLAEALSQAINELAPAEKMALFKRYAGKLTAAEATQVSALSDAQLAQATSRLELNVACLLTWFHDERDELVTLQAEGGSLERYFMVLDDPVTETIATEIIMPHLKAFTPAEPEPAAPVPAKSAKKGLSGFFGWFKKSK